MFTSLLISGLTVQRILKKGANEERDERKD